MQEQKNATFARGFNLQAAAITASCLLQTESVLETARQGFVRDPKTARTKLLEIGFVTAMISKPTSLHSSLHLLASKMRSICSAVLLLSGVGKPSQVQGIRYVIRF